MAINYPKLYNSKNDTTGIGLGVLRDCISCVVTEERNGIFELEMTYKMDGFLSDELHIGKIIKANASKTLRNQLFRIYNIKRNLDGNITVYAEHIFFDLRKSFVPRVNLGKPISANTAIMNVIQSSSNAKEYTASSDITTEHNVLYEFKSALECIVGSTGSIVDTWNGDLLRNNSNIKYLNNRGQDKGVHVTYTKNMTGFEAVEDMDSVVTAIYPYVLLPKEADTEGYDGATVTGNESVYLDNDIITLPGTGYIYADNYQDFDTIFYQGVDFTDDEFWNTYAVNANNLEILSSRYFGKTKCNIPSSTYEVDLIALSETEEYKNFAFMEDIDLCDTVTVNNKKFGIKDKVKVTELKFNSLTDKIESLKLGGSSTSLSSQLNSKLDEIKEVINSNKTETEKVIEYVTQQITGCDGGYVKLFPPHNPQEIFIMNNEDPMKATEVLRINKSGIGFGSSINGPFRTGWTASGVFNADFIKTGSLSANLIKSGILTNVNGTIQINLESDTIDFYKMQNSQLMKGISINGPIVSFYDWQGANALSGMLSINRLVGNDGSYGVYPIIALNHETNSFTTIGYRKNDGSGVFTPYMVLDAYNRGGMNPDGYPVRFPQPVRFSSNVVANNGYKLLAGDNSVLLYTASGATGLRGSTIGGTALLDKDGQYILWIKPGSKEITYYNNYYFNRVYLDEALSFGMSKGSDNMTILRGSSGVTIATGSTRIFDFIKSGSIAYSNIDMRGYSITNSTMLSTYADSNTRSFFNTYTPQSLQQELSYTFESMTKGKETKIYLNENINCITENDYMVQLTAYADSRIWCKKFDNYFIVYTSEENVEFSCRVIKKISENAVEKYANIINDYVEEEKKDEELYDNPIQYVEENCDFRFE